MNLLAIDTTTDQASVALFVNGMLHNEVMSSQKMHAQVLLPVIDTLFTRSQSTLSMLDAIAFGCGPGSFTGLRIACSIAKGLAYAQGLPLIPVNSLDIIAWSAREQLKNDQLSVLSVLDARMSELYWGFYKPSDYKTTYQVSNPESILIEQTQHLVLAGAGFLPYWEAFPESIKKIIAQQLIVVPDARAIVNMVLTMKLPQVSSADAEPIYVRNRVTQGDPRG